MKARLAAAIAGGAVVLTVATAAWLTRPPDNSRSPAGNEERIFLQASTVEE
jgi:hypothetical protein